MNAVLRYVHRLPPSGSLLDDEAVPPCATHASLRWLLQWPWGAFSISRMRNIPWAHGSRANCALERDASLE
jgi:hypothetical protein